MDYCDISTSHKEIKLLISCVNWSKISTRTSTRLPIMRCSSEVLKNCIAWFCKVLFSQRRIKETDDDDDDYIACVVLCLCLLRVNIQCLCFWLSHKCEPGLHLLTSWQKYTLKKVWKQTFKLSQTFCCVCVRLCNTKYVPVFYSLKYQRISFRSGHCQGQIPITYIGPQASHSASN